MIAAVGRIEDEGPGRAGKFFFGPEGFDKLGGSHVSAGADVEAGVGAELEVDRRFEAFVAVVLAGLNHHFEDFVAVELLRHLRQAFL